MLRTLLFTLLTFVVQLNAFADLPLQQCRQLYSQQDSQAAFETCLPLAAQGSGEASFILSNLYTQGIGDKQADLQQALVWLLESAKQGHAAACFNLAALYERGKIVEQDYAMAYSWYEKGAQRGHAGSQFKVGIMSLKGTGTEENAKKAKAWLDKAAESGNQNAQVTQAILLSVSDAQKSLDWYNRAADQGNPLAYYQLAEIHAEGKQGQPVDLKEALYLAQKSVILGRAASQVLVDRIRQEINNSATVELAPTELAVSETANSDVSLGDTDETVEAVNETVTGAVIKTEKTAPETAGPETLIAETAAVKTTAPKTAIAEGIDTETDASVPATPEVDTVADTRSEVAPTEVASSEDLGPEAVSPEVTAVAGEVNNESQPLAVMQAQPHLLTEQSTNKPNEKPTELAVSETANSDVSLSDTDETVEAVNETVTGAVIKTEKTAPETAAVKTTAPKTAIAEGIDTEIDASVPATPEVDTVADTRSEVATTEVASSENLGPEAVSPEVTAAAGEVNNESQPLAVMQAQPHLLTEQSTNKPNEKPTVSEDDVNTGLPVMHKDKAWLMSQPSGRYVLQLAQLDSETSVMRFLKQMDLEGKANYYRAHTNAGRVYVVLYSESYPGLQAAKKAVRQTFSTELQNSVWYRRYKALQTSYRAP